MFYYPNKPTYDKKQQHQNIQQQQQKREKHLIFRKHMLTLTNTNVAYKQPFELNPCFITKTTTTTTKKELKRKKNLIFISGRFCYL